MSREMLIYIRNNLLVKKVAIFDNFPFTKFQVIKSLIFSHCILAARNPQSWVRPYAAEVVYNYKSSSPHELSIYPGQLIQLAPKEVQQTHKLLNTGWALATIDNKTSGLVPINYVRRVEAKHFTTNPADQPVIAPEMPIAPNMEPIPEFDASHFNNQTGEICTSKMPPDSNEIITNASTPSQIDLMMPADIKDL